MSIRNATGRLLAALLFIVTLLGTTSEPALAEAQTDTVTPTAWRWRANVTPTTLGNDINDGYRIVDLEVEDDNPLRFSAVMVRNTGDYAKGWWWYYGQTSSQVTSRLSQHNARLIDVEPYQTSAGIRYAIVLVPNTGTDFASSHGWVTGQSFTGVSNWLNANPTRRIIDIQPYISGGVQRYAFIWVSNTGQQQSGYWVYMNTSPSFISSQLAANNARLIDLEIHENSGNMSAIMVPRDGNVWYWYYGLQGGDVDRVANQLACRMIDLQRYPTSSGTRYAMLLRRNDNDLTVEATSAMRAFLPLSATSGLILREFNGFSSTMAGTFEDRVFEPASLLKTVHHFAAMREIALGNRSLNSLVIERTGLNGSCPTGSNPVARTMQDVLRDMMEQSSNTATEAIRANLGTSLIVNTAGLFGATNVALNHTLGCLCGLPRNRVTLRDLADLHDAVTDGALFDDRDTFYDLMSNGSNFGMGAYSTSSVLNQELAASTLTAEEEAAFRAGVRFAHKGGSYTCIFGSNREEHRSRGAYVRLPHRSGCGTVYQEYFIGAWVNDAVTSSSANNATGIALTTLYRDRVRAAIDSWEAASCNPFVNYCSANPNSTGQIGRCTATGSPYVLTNSLTIRASRLPQNSFGSLLVSPTAGFSPNAGGSEGNLCLGGNIGRYFNQIMDSGSSGTMALQINLNAIPRPAGAPFAVMAGDVLRFQWWHRDSSSSGSATSNFTEGLRVTFI